MFFVICFFAWGVDFVFVVVIGFGVCVLLVEVGMLVFDLVEYFDMVLL